ncbi:MAG TPA: 3-phosphoshikimate 1-carboxyvinyltransferase, partial [Acidimicrobiales bacterium]|nr:3-phosphoshikimate 1-carboxyvinyltransferase [Acidimicrobiales bacterium]
MAGDRLRLAGGRPLRGAVRVPGDKSISHRALMLAALAEGRSVLTGLSTGDDVSRTGAALAALGAGVSVSGTSWVIEGGRARLGEPAEVLDLGNSGTSLRLLAGICAGLDGLSVLSGDSSLRRRPVDRVVEPLGRMGARLDARAGGRYPPLVVRGGRLAGIDYALPVASAQVKSAVLLAGLGARGPTVVREPVLTRVHTEEMLASLGADIEREPAGPGQVVRLCPSPLAGFQLSVPGDPSQAAFWVVAALVVPDSEVRVKGVYLGPGRSGFLAVLRRMGAEVGEHPGDDGSYDLVARHCPLSGTVVGPEEVPGLIDEVPALCVAAAFARGTTTFEGASELFHKESNRAVAMARVIADLGGRAQATQDGIRVEGGGLRGGRTHSGGDHRVAMAAA